MRNYFFMLFLKIVYKIIDLTPNFEQFCTFFFYKRAHPNLTLWRGSWCSLHGPPSSCSHSRVLGCRGSYQSCVPARAPKSRLRPVDSQSDPVRKQVIVPVRVQYSLIQGWEKYSPWAPLNYWIWPPKLKWIILTVVQGSLHRWLKLNRFSRWIAATQHCDQLGTRI